MFDKIKALLTSEPKATRNGEFDELHIAVAALLIRAASTADERFDETERGTIVKIISAFFALEPDEIAALVDIAAKEEAETLDLHRWAQAIKKHYEEDARITLIEKMWEVVYADGILDDYEANLLRRVAGLIYVPDRQSGEARLRVLARLGLA